jgi:hypothetical protein
LSIRGGWQLTQLGFELRALKWIGLAMEIGSAEFASAAAALNRRD